MSTTRPWGPPATPAPAPAAEPVLPGRRRLGRSRTLPPWASRDLALVGALLVVATPIVVSLILDRGRLYAGLFTLGMAVLSPALGLMMFAFVVPLVWQPVLPAPGFPLLLAGSIVLGAVLRLPLDRPRLRPAPALLVLGAFLFFVFAHLPVTLFSYEGEQARFAGSLMGKLITLGLLILGAALVLRHRSPYPFLAAAILSACVCALLAIVAWMTDPTPRLLSNLVAPSSAATRPAGSITDPNYYGLFIAGAIVVVVGLIVGVRRRWLRGALLVPLAVLAIGLVVGQSRTSLGALVLGLAAALYVRDRRIGIAVVVVGVALGLVVYPILVQARLTNAFGDVSATAQAALAASDADRLRKMLQGPVLFLSSPIVGIGLGGYRLWTGDASHDWFLTILAEQGLVGFALWVALLVAVALELRRRPLLARSIGTGVFTVLLVGCVFLEPPFDTQSVVLSMVVLVACLVADWDPGGARPVTAGPELRHASRAAPRLPTHARSD